MAVRAALGLDEFNYFESLARLDGYPELIYVWRLERIGKQTAPWVEETPDYFVRDDARSAYKEIDQTDAWEDDGGHAGYVFECRLLDEHPKRRSSTAIY